MEIKNIFSALETTPLDSKAGIRLVKLTGEKDISVYAADIAPKTDLRPHYHNFGIDTYQILKGEGVMRVGTLKNGKADWSEVFTAKVGLF